MRDVHDGIGIDVLHAALPNRRCDPHNQSFVIFRRFGDATVIDQPDSLTDGILIGKVHVREPLIDDHRFPASFPITAIERPTT